MLKQILALTWKDLKVFFKDTGGMVFIFLQPFMFIVVMSYALGGLFGGGSEAQAIHILVVNQDRGTRAADVIRQLGEMKGFQVETEWDGQPITRAQAERLVMSGKRSLAVVFPEDLSAALEQHPLTPTRLTTKVLFLCDPATSDQFVQPLLGTLNGLLQRASLEATLPQGIEYLFAYLQPEASEAERQTFKAQAQAALSGGTSVAGQATVTVERVAPPGMQVPKLPNTFQQNVPGYTIYGIFWIVSLLASSVLEERQEGTFRRLLVAPMGRAVMLAGKLLPYYIINLLQLAIMLGASSLLFGLNLGSSAAGLVAVCLAAAATATGLGVLVAALARTNAQIGGLTTLLLLTLSALGGCFVPRFIMPDWLRTAGLLTPHAWALDAFQDLMVRGYGLAQVLPKVGVLAGFAGLFFCIGVWRFRFE